MLAKLEHFKILYFHIQVMIIISPNFENWLWLCKIIYLEYGIVALQIKSVHFHIHHRSIAFPFYELLHCI